MRYECSLSKGHTWNTPCVLCTLASALPIIDSVHTSSTPVFYGALRPLTISGQLFNPDIRIQCLHCRGVNVFSGEQKLSRWLPWPPADSCLWDGMAGLASSLQLLWFLSLHYPKKSVRLFQCGVTHHWTDSR